MMKKLLNILALCCCICLAACSNDDNPVESGVQVIATSGIDFSAGGGEGTIVVSANGAISASSDQDWCTVTVEETTVHVVATASTEMTSRSALITISSESGFAEVPVIQSGVITVMNEYNLYHSFTYEGGNLVFPFKTNTNYSIECPEDAKSWLSYEVDEANNQILFTVANNASRTPRGTEVKLIVGGKETVLGISQIEVTEADLAGTWNCSYLTMTGEPLSGSVLMGYTSTGQLAMNDVAGGVLNSLNGSFPLRFEDGNLFLQFAVLGETSQYMLITATVDSDGLLNLVDCLAVPQYKDGNLVYHFGYSNNEALGGVGDAGPCFVMLDGTGSKILEVLEIYNNFVISKPIN